jgi:hypothetical protein
VLYFLQHEIALHHLLPSFRVSVRCCKMPAEY